MDYSTQTVAQLKEILKEKGLATDGKKADLIARLNEESNEEKPTENEEPQVESEPVVPQQNQESEQSQESKPTEEKPEEASEPKPKEKPKELSPEERKSLAIELLNKKIQRAEKFNDEESLTQSKKDLARVEKFGVELGTSLAKELGLVNNQLNNGIRDGKFKPKHKKFRKRY